MTTTSTPIPARSPALTLALALCLASLAAPALAQDSGLYADVPDPNASFVRIVAANLTNAVVDTKTFDQLDSGISGYVMVSQPGDIKVVTGLDEATVTVEPGKYYTYIVAKDGSANLVTEDTTSNPAQAMVSVFNLSDLPVVDLYVPAAKVVAVTGVPMDGTGSVALKAPLTLDFELRSGDKVVATLVAVDLQRRGSVAILLRGSGGTYEAVMAESTLAR